MAFDLATAVSLAREILGVGSSSRYPDTRLYAHGNAALRRCVEIWPDPFAVEAWMDLQNGVEQIVPAALGCREFRGVLAFRQGLKILGSRPFDVSLLSQFRPAWRGDKVALPTQYQVIPGRIDAFICYPPADTSMSARITFVQTFVDYAAGQAVPLPNTILPAIASYIAGMAEMADEEHVNSNRASQLLADFSAAVGQAAGAPAK